MGGLHLTSLGIITDSSLYSSELQKKSDVLEALWRCRSVSKLIDTDIAMFFSSPERCTKLFKQGSFYYLDSFSLILDQRSHETGYPLTQLTHTS